MPRVRVHDYQGWRKQRFACSFSPQPNGCWNWTRRIGRGGYGNASYRGKNVQAHRLAWSLFRGPIPEGMLVCHSCDNRRCVNPAHLWLGTQKDNLGDRDAKGRSNYQRGARNGAAKLDESAVLAIRADCRPIAQIAAQHRISQAAVSLIRNRKVWTHL